METELVETTPKETPVVEMKTPEAQVEEQASKTINVSLSEKQMGILTKLTKDKQALQKDFNVLQDKENDLITLILEFKEITADSVQNIQPSQDGKSLIITLK